MGLSVYLHLLITELRHILLLYFAFYTWLSTKAYFHVTHVIMSYATEQSARTDILASASNVTSAASSLPTIVAALQMGPVQLGDLLSCIKHSTQASLFQFDYASSCAPVFRTVQRLDFGVNVAFLVLNGVFILSILISARGQHFAHGEYLTFTQTLRASRLFRSFMAVELAFMGFLIAWSGYFIWRDYTLGKFIVVDMLLENGSQLMILAYSTWALFYQTEVSIGILSPDFEDLHFRRSFRTLVSQTNGEFLISLERAHRKATYGDPSELRALISDDSPWELDKVLHALEPPVVLQVGTADVRAWGGGIALGRGLEADFEARAGLLATGSADAVRRPGPQGQHQDPLARGPQRQEPMQRYDNEEHQDQESEDGIMC